jgi:SHS family lactate transporter-like MFS transporter
MNACRPVSDSLHLQFLFGILSDRFGRKWPLVAILLFSSLLQFGTGFTQTLELFFLLRCLSGLAMGGVWGIAVSNALENLPVETRGLASGILAQGYAVGYLVSIIMITYLVPYNRHSWSILFWIGSGTMALAAYFRAVLPESPAFLNADTRRVEKKTRSGQECSAIREVGRLLKTNWKSTCICVAIVSSA